MVAEVTIFVNNLAKQNPQTCMATTMLGHFYDKLKILHTIQNYELMQTSTHYRSTSATQQKYNYGPTRLLPPTNVCVCDCCILSNIKKKEIVIITCITSKLKTKLCQTTASLPLQSYFHVQLATYCYFVRWMKYNHFHFEDGWCKNA